VKLKVYEIPGRKKKLKGCGKGDPSQVERTKAWAPPKRAGQGQPPATFRQEYEIFQFGKGPLD